MAFASGGLFLIADGSANVAVIPGEPAADWRKADLSDHPLRVAVNGEQVATGSSNLLMWGNPYAAVAYLVPIVGLIWFCTVPAETSPEHATTKCNQPRKSSGR